MDGSNGARITVRTMAAALLENGGDMLMMHRSPTRTLAPGLWSAVGGHLEGDEFHDPGRGCLREVMEETGLGPDQLGGFRLRYILYRLWGTELRHQYIFHAQTTTRRVGATEEGTLQWVPKRELAGLDMPPSAIALVDRFLEDERVAEPPIAVGILTRTGFPGGVGYGPFDAHWVGLMGLGSSGGPTVRYDAVVMNHKSLVEGSLLPERGEVADPVAGAIRIMADRWGKGSIISEPHATGFLVSPNRACAGGIIHTVAFQCGTDATPLLVGVQGNGDAIEIPLNDWEPGSGILPYPRSTP